MKYGERKYMFKKSVNAMFVLVFLLGMNCNAANYIISGVTVDNIIIYEQGFSIVTLTTEASNLGGCLGTKDGKGSGYYLHVNNKNPKILDAIEAAYLAGRTINIGLRDECTSWGGITIPKAYRVQI